MGDSAIRTGGSSMALAGFVASFLLEGLQKCSGVLFCGTLVLSDETRETAAVPYIVSRATAYIASVFSQGCVQSQKRECRLLFGTLMCSLGAALSFISNDDVWLTVCWGVFFGTGIGVAFPESLRVSEKYNGTTLSTLLKSTAQCFSCILLPHLMQFLISSFGISGCLLVLSGIMLNAVPFILTAMYKIDFNSKKTKLQIKKKCNIDSDKPVDVVSADCNGIVNAAYVSDSSDQFEVSNQNSDSERHKETTTKELFSNGSLKETNADSDQFNNRLKKVQPDFQGLDEVIRKLGRDPETISEVHNHDSDNNLFENSFSEEDILYEVTSNSSHKPTIHVDVSKQRTGSHVHHTNSVTFKNLKPSNRKRTLSVKCIVNSTSPCIISEEDMESDITNDVKLDSSEQIMCTPVRKKTSLSQGVISEPPVIPPVHRNILVNNTSSDTINSNHGNFPLEIKVHVVECTFSASELQDKKFLQGIKKNCYRKHSNSLITSNYDNVDFTSPSFLKKHCRLSSITRNTTTGNPRMHLISEDDEVSVDANNPSNAETSNESPNSKLKKLTKWLTILKKIFRPSCLVIIYSFVIYEITLITLLTIFDDLVTDAGVDGAQAVGVLPAFGLGGIAGRLSLKYWGDRLLLESSHGTAALLFILDGIVVAGILWSPNLYWIGGFYAALGFLEVGISTTVWNLVSDYIDEEVKSGLFSTCSLFCGICTLFVPYTIGLSRDDLGEYDGLLQITSGLSVLCALLCYILPRFTSHTRHMRGS